MQGSSPSSSLEQQLAGVVKALNARDLGAAQRSLVPVMAAHPNHPSVLYLAGGVAKMAGKAAEALALYERSLRAAPKQPQVWHALGVLRFQGGDMAGAIAAFEKALALAPRYPEALANLARVHLTLEDWAAARRRFEAVLALIPGNAAALMGLAQAALGENDPDKALSHLAPLLGGGGTPNARALQLASRAHAAVGAFAEALKVLQPVISAPNAPRDLLAEAARAAFRAGQGAVAIALADRAIAAAPTEERYYREAATMRYTLGEADYLGAYETALERAPNDAGLLSGYAYAASITQAPERAVPVLKRAISSGQRDPRVLSMAGLAAAKSGDIEDARAFHFDAAHAAPEDIAVQNNFAAFVLEHDDPAEAVRAADRVLSQDPANQLALGYLTAARQRLGDPAADGLFAPDVFTERQAIACPPGYESLPDFNAALAADLLSLHSTVREPMDQSLRGGTQLELSGLAVRIPTVRLLLDALLANVRAFAGSLPREEGHPFLGRRPDRFEFSGVWSVRLQDGGHHVSHVHPEGWLSSCYYVSLPSVMAGSDDHQGWLRLGAPPWTDLSAPRPSDGAVDVEPLQGHLILFPSYFWHGTIPFRSEAPRLTVAFDIKPLAGRR